MFSFIGNIVRAIQGTLGCIRCGHSEDSHLHYRGGSDCALCHCRRWL